MERVKSYEIVYRLTGPFVQELVSEEVQHDTHIYDKDTEEGDFFQQRHFTF